MNEETRRVLELLDQKKISVDEAEKLLGAVNHTEPEGSQSSTQAAEGKKPRFLRVLVQDAEDQVDVRVPLQLLRAGIKLGALIPQEAKNKIDSALDQKGIHFDIANMKPEDMEALISALAELQVNVKSAENENVRVFCE